MPYICTHKQRLSTFAAWVSRGAKPYATHLWYATRDRTGTATWPREIRVAMIWAYEGERSRVPSSACYNVLLANTYLPGLEGRMNSQERGAKPKGAKPLQ
jgi:hypothetical protein